MLSVFLMKLLSFLWMMFLTNNNFLYISMKRFQPVILLLLFSITVPVYSQLSQYIDGTDIMSMSNVAKYQGKKFLYYNLFSYDGAQSLPPMPFQSDRIRDGKYKASATAMNNYIEEFKKNNGKVFSFVKFFKNPQQGLGGVVFASETGDTVFVDSRGVNEFFSSDYLELEKKNIGKALYEIDLTSGLASFKNNSFVIPAFFTYSEAKTKELKPTFLPFMSEWIIKDVNYDTNYYGEHSEINDAINMNHNRLYYLIENKKYGSLICFFNEQKHTFSKDEAYSKLADLMRMKMVDFYFDDEDRRLLEKWATDGTADMKYFYFAVTEEKGKNKEEVRSELIKFAEQGSVVAAYKLLFTPAFYLDIPYEKLAEIVKKTCKPGEKLNLYSEMYMKMGKIIPLRLLDRQDDLDKAFAVGKEMYQFAEKCGADSQKLESAKEELQEEYDACLKDKEETK